MKMTPYATTPEQQSALTKLIEIQKDGASGVSPTSPGTMRIDVFRRGGFGTHGGGTSAAVVRAPDLPAYGLPWTTRLSRLAVMHDLTILEHKGCDQPIFAREETGR